MLLWTNNLSVIGRKRFGLYLNRLKCDSTKKHIFFSFFFVISKTTPLKAELLQCSLWKNNLSVIGLKRFGAYLNRLKCDSTENLAFFFTSNVLWKLLTALSDRCSLLTRPNAVADSTQIRCWLGLNALLTRKLGAYVRFWLAQPSLLTRRKALSDSTYGPLLTRALLRVVWLALFRCLTRPLPVAVSWPTGQTLNFVPV